MSPFERFQSDVFGRLSTLPAIADVAGVLFRPREKMTAAIIQSKVDAILTGKGVLAKDGKMGAAYTVLMPIADVTDIDAEGPDFECKCTIRVQEVPLINMGAAGTGLSAESIAVNVAAGLHHFNSGLGYFYCPKDAITPVGPADATDPRITYDVVIATHFAVEPLRNIPRPTISGTAAAVQLACLDGAAEIWFTTDNTFPAPNAGTSLLYTIPFSVTAPALVRAAAYKADVQGSDIATKTINS